MRAWACVVAAAALAAAGLLPPDTERLRAPVGGYALMNCHLDFPFGNEIPYHLQWDKDGEPIFSWYSGLGAEGGGGGGGAGEGRVARARAPGLGGGAINLTAVREADAGLYRCRVTFPNRTPPARNNGTFYYLQVDGSNLILTPPSNVTVLEGEPAELECAPKEAEWSVAWSKDGAPLAELPELAARAEVLPTGGLRLRAAASPDAGRYECTVRAPDLTAQTAAAFLDVQYKAKVVYSPGERSLALGKPASLDCHFSANPPLTNLRWEKDGFLFDPYNVPGVFYSRNGSLLFNQVEESHEGEYSCTPYNALGTAGPSGRVRVRVQRPPALAVRPQPLYVARLGQPLSLPCEPAPPPHHHPPPHVLWARKDGAELPEGRYSVEGGNLTLSSVGEEDGGVYVCSVRNEAAAVSAEAEVRVDNVLPRAPHGLRAAPGAHHVHLTWAGARGADAEYTVWYRERAASEWRTMRLLSRGVTEATLVGLRPGRQYELRVLAQDHIGDGLFSRALYVRTLDEEGSGAGERGEEAQTEPAAATEAPAQLGAEPAAAPADHDHDGQQIEVSVRLVDGGALVRWARGAGDDSRCTARWADASLPGAERALLTMHTHHDYVLVSSVEEGARYVARVWCVSGAAGRGEVRVPEYGRLRAVAAGAAAAALLLAAAGAALYLARRRLCAPPAPCPPAPPAPPAPRRPPPPPRADKRRF